MRLGRWIRAALAAGVVTATTLFVAGPAGAQPAAPGQWSQTFGDEFNGSSLSSAWSTCFMWGTCSIPPNREQEWYQPSNDVVAGGHLAEIIGHDPSVHNGVTYPYSSGLVTSAGSYNFRYGYVEMSAKIPANCPACWPGLWMIPSDGSWPPEIDVDEHFGGNPTMVNQDLHWLANGVDAALANSHYDAGVDYSAGYHTFAVDWEPGSLTWYIDGRVTESLVGSQVPNMPMYLVIQLGIGPWASIPAGVNPEFDIDWVRVWQHGTPSVVASSGPGSAPTAVVPESPLAVALPISGVAIVGGLLYLRRRRHTA